MATGRRCPSTIIILLSSAFGTSLLAIILVTYFNVVGTNDYSDIGNSFPTNTIAFSGKNGVGIVQQQRKEELIHTLIDMTKTEANMYWHEIYLHAFNVTNRSFCLPWTVDSDNWWTHHPDFEVFDETATRYCFQLIPDTSRLELMREIYRTQFHGNCSNVFTLTTVNSGWGADSSNLRQGLSFAMNEKRPMQIHGQPWHYAAPDEAGKPNDRPTEAACPLMTMYCYFLNLSNCEVRAGVGEWDSEEWDADDDIALQEYVLRPQTWLRHKMIDFIHNQKIETPCTVFHVRRSDVILHDGKFNRKYHAISEYIEAPLRNRSTISAENNNDQNMNVTLHENILLLTDDHNAIGEAKKLHPNHNWMYIDRPRFKAEEGGWERQIPSNDPSFEVLVLLSTLRLVQYCDSFIYSHSNFANLLKKSMEKSNLRAQFINLDYHVNPFSRDNKASKIVSKDYTKKSAGNRKLHISEKSK